MKFLTNKDEALYEQLVELAGGDAELVTRVLSPQPNRTQVDLRTLIDEISQERETTQQSPLGSRSS